MPMFLLRMVGQQNAYRHPTNQTTSQRSNCAGKHPPWKEVEALGMKDLEAVSSFLGDKVRFVRRICFKKWDEEFPRNFQMK